MIAAYHRLLTNPDLQVRLAAAKAWSVWEGSTLSLVPDAERIRHFGADAYAIAFACIECHYFVNAGFFASDGQLLTDAWRLADIPGDHHPRPLRCGDAGQECLGPQSGLAERRVAHRRRCRTCHERAGYLT